MKKLILCVFLAVTAAVTTEASRAFTEPMTVRQPDGTQITVRQFGDADHHWMETTDGVMVVHTTQGYFVATITDNGDIMPSDLLVHCPGQRTAEESALIGLQASRRQLFHQTAQHRTAQRRATVPTDKGYVPHTGSPRILVVLTAYADTPFTIADPNKSFEQYFNSEADSQENYGNREDRNKVSVRQYFSLSSGGKFTPQFDIVGPITLSEKLAYYGGTGNDGKDDEIFKLASEAMNLVKEQHLVSDFSVYDNDGDGNAELVYFVHTGYGQHMGGANNTIWAKVSSGGTTIDGVHFNRIGFSCELFYPNSGGRETDISGIGTFCHEFSHAMGLPDLYQDNNFVNNQGMEYWDVMDGGLYTEYGYAPTPYTAWEQEAMGWTTIEKLETSQDITNLKPLIDGGKAYKFGNGANSEEFIMLENMQWKGFNGKAYGGHGLLVYHVAYKSSTVGMSDYPNSEAGHPRVALVPADGLMINNFLQTELGGSYSTSEYNASFKGDPFPGSQNVTQLTDDMNLPNYKFYNGEAATGCSLLNISEDTTAKTVSFHFSNGDDTAIHTIRIDDPHHASGFYTLDGRRVDAGHDKLPAGLYIHNGKKVVIH